MAKDGAGKENQKPQVPANWMSSILLPRDGAGETRDALQSRLLNRGIGCRPSWRITGFLDGAVSRLTDLGKRHRFEAGTRCIVSSLLDGPRRCWPMERSCTLWADSGC